MKIGLVSDIHASPAPLQEALQLFREHHVEWILCAGDIAGYGERLDETIALLIESGCLSILGNHDLWHFERRDHDEESATADYLRSLPTSLDIEIEGVMISMVHASPSGTLLDGIKLLDEIGLPIKEQLDSWADTLNGHPADILVVGHTHQVFVRQLGGLLVINPGSTVFNHTCAILSLPEKTVEFFPLSGKEPVLSWNFSMFKEMQM